MTTEAGGVLVPGKFVLTDERCLCYNRNEKRPNPMGDSPARVVARGSHDTPTAAPVQVSVAAHKF